jgi:hypothetical protein
MAHVLNVLLPPRARLASVEPFARWVARGSALPEGRAGYLEAVAEPFRWPDGPLPVAALIRQAVAGDAGDALWMCADPAWVQPELSSARLLGHGQLGLSAADAASMVSALEQSFAEQGMSLHVGDPQHWQVRLPNYLDLPPFPAPEEALGADLFEQLPHGDEGRRWRALINEAQVVLHNHPANAARVRQGLPAINSVWFWGAGMLPAWVESGLSRIYSDDLLLWSLGQKASVDVQARNAFGAGDGGPFVLLDLQDAQPVEFERTWWPALAQRMADGAELRLSFADGQRHVVRNMHRLRFWRNA